MGKAGKTIFAALSAVALAALMAFIWLFLAFRPAEFSDKNGTWVLVPGVGTFNTEDFYVMKYEAKCVDLSSGQIFAGNHLGIYDHSENPCVKGLGRMVKSVQPGHSIGYVSHNDAKEYCESMGAHLLTNEEFMSIARGVETVRENWSGGAEGKGLLYYGNSGAHMSALPGEYEVNEGEMADSAEIISEDGRRWFALSSGARIFDLAGNLWEHVARTSEDLSNFVDLPSCSDGAEEWGYCGYGETADSAVPYVANWTDDVSFSYIGPQSPLLTTESGAGEIYTFKSGGKKRYASTFMRGGSFSTPLGGIYSLSLKPESKGLGDYADVGFRCAKSSRFILPF